MPWYFYGKNGAPVVPKSPSNLPPGSIVVYPIPYTGVAPEGFLFCDGQQYLISQYLNLYAEILTTFGGTATHFNVPDLRGRMLRGITALSQGVGAVTGVGGSSSHTHTLSSHTHTMSSTHTHTMPFHNHNFPNHTHALGNHTHGNGGLTIGNTNNTNLTDTREDNTGSPVMAIADNNGIHNHGGALTGITGGVSGLNPPGAVSSSAGSHNSGGADDSSLASTTFSGTSGGSGALTSTGPTPASALPPYTAFSFIIKV